MAVYTNISDTDAARFVATYDIGDFTRLEAIQAGVENSNYHLFTSRGRFILTLFEKRVRGADLPFFFALTDHLSAHGLRCPQAVADRSGDIFRMLQDRPAVVVTYLDGACVDGAEITPEHCHALGSGLARMHIATRDFTGGRDNNMGLHRWGGLFEKIGVRADEIVPGLAQLIGAELSYLRTHWPHDLPSGAVHADLFPDNVFFKGDKLYGFIDFYFACTDFYAYDLAITLGAWCFDAHGVRDDARYHALLAGYSAVRPLSDAELRAFSVLCRGAAMRFLLSRLHDYIFHDVNDFVTPKDPRPYLTILRHYQTGEGAAP